MLHRVGRYEISDDEQDFGSVLLLPSSTSENDGNSDAEQVKAMLVESSSDEECSLDEEEEIWESSSTEGPNLEENPQDESSEGIIYGVSLSLNFFQVLYRVSERGILALLAFM